MPSRSERAAFSASVKNLTIGDFHSPFSTLMKASPLAPALGEFGEFLDLARGHAGEALCVHRLHDTARVEGRAEDLEL